MLTIFKSNKDLMLEKLNALTGYVAKYQCTYDKNEGYILSFPTVSLDTDMALHHIQAAINCKTAFQRGNGLNGVNGTRLILPEADLTNKMIEEAAVALHKIYHKAYKRSLS